MMANMGAVTIRLAKIDDSFTFDVDALPETSQRYAVAMGLTQSVNDTVAGVKRADFETDQAFREACLAKYNVRIEQILSGNVPGTRAPADPKLAVMKRAAAEHPDIPAEEFAAIIAAGIAARKLAA